MIITQPTLNDIPAMREILSPEVERGVILERSVEVNIKGHYITIYRDDMEDVWVDNIVNGELSGGTFDEVL